MKIFYYFYSKSFLKFYPLLQKQSAELNSPDRSREENLLPSTFKLTTNLFQQSSVSPNHSSFSHLISTGNEMTHIRNLNYFIAVKTMLTTNDISQISILDFLNNFYLVSFSRSKFGTKSQSDHVKEVSWESFRPFCTHQCSHLIFFKKYCCLFHIQTVT